MDIVRYYNQVANDPNEVGIINDTISGFYDEYNPIYLKHIDSIFNLYTGRYDEAFCYLKYLSNPEITVKMEKDEYGNRTLIEFDKSELQYSSISPEFEVGGNQHHFVKFEYFNKACKVFQYDIHFDVNNWGEQDFSLGAISDQNYTILREGFYDLEYYEDMTDSLSEIVNNLLVARFNKYSVGNIKIPKFTSSRVSYLSVPYGGMNFDCRKTIRVLDISKHNSISRQVSRHIYDIL